MRESEAQRRLGLDPGSGARLGKTPDRHVRKRVLIGVAVLVFVVIAVRNVIPPAPLAPPNCEVTALFLPSTEFRQGEQVRFTITGPDGARFSVGLDVRGLDESNDYAPLPARAAEFAFRSKPVTTTSCRATGRIGTPVKPGEHTFTLFRLDGGVRVVSSTTVTVTKR